MGSIRVLPTPVTGVRLADAVRVFLDTIVARNTRATYAAARRGLCCADSAIDALTH